MAKPPVNYTTKIPARRSASECNDLLVDAGADSVAITYDQGQPTGLSFRIGTPNGRRDFALPVNIDGIGHLLKHADYPATVKTIELSKYLTREHAVRVGWRILRDWLEAQLAIIAAGMVTLEQVMLPYLEVAPGQTLYDRYLEQSSAGALMPGESSS